MGEAYFNFLVDQLINWFQDSNFNLGSRYYLLLKDQTSVDHLFNNLQQTKKINTQPFVLNNQQGVYQTLALVRPELQAVIMPFGQNATTNYLLQLQNQLSMQQGAFDHTIVIYLCANSLAGVLYNARNLSDTGGPFDLNNMLKSLAYMQSVSALKPGEKVLLADGLNQVLRRPNHHLVEKLANIYELLQDTTLQSAAYLTYHYFYDPKLQKVDTSTAENRIQKNHKYFTDLSQIVADRAGSQLVENYLYCENTQDYQLFKNPKQWIRLTYDQVDTARQNFLKQTFSKTELRSDKLTSLNRNFLFWTQRKRYGDIHAQAHSAKEYSILAFLQPSSNNQPVSLRLPFTTTLDRTAIDMKNSFLFAGNEDHSDLIKVVNRMVVLNLGRGWDKSPS